MIRYVPLDGYHNVKLRYNRSTCYIKCSPCYSMITIENHVYNFRKLYKGLFKVFSHFPKCAIEDIASQLLDDLNHADGIVSLLIKESFRTILTRCICNDARIVGEISLVPEYIIKEIINRHMFDWIYTGVFNRNPLIRGTTVYGKNINALKFITHVANYTQTNRIPHAVIFMYSKTYDDYVRIAKKTTMISLKIYILRHIKFECPYIVNGIPKSLYRPDLFMSY